MTVLNTIPQLTVAAVGECMVEFAPESGGLYRLGFAGDTFNTAWALRLLLPRRFGVRYVTAIGSDWMSDAMLDFMSGGGIDTAFVARIAHRGPGLYAIRVVEGERTFAYWRQDSAATRLADDPARLAAALEGVALIFVSGITLAVLPPAGRATLIAALRRARTEGARIVFDPNYRPRLWANPATARAAFEEAFRTADVALPTFADERDLFGDVSPAATAERLHALGVAEVVVKNGADPVLCITDTGRFEVAAEIVPTLIDTSGAGDAFNAGFLSARLQDSAPPAAVAEGHRIAAIAVQSRGALLKSLGLPTSA